MKVHLAIITLIFVASFGTPLLASAAGLCDAAQEADCSSVGKVCDPNTGGCLTVTSGGGNNQTVTTGGGNTGVTLINPLQGGGNLESFLYNILAFVIRIGTIAVILMLVYVGYLFVVARGEPGKITEARSALLWTVVGALILLGSQAIAIAIKSTVQAISAGG